MLKPPSFDAVDPEAGRKPVEDSRQFHRLGEAKMKGRTAPKAAGNRVGAGVLAARGISGIWGNWPKPRLETKDLACVFWANHPNPCFCHGLLGVCRR